MEDFRPFELKSFEEAAEARARALLEGALAERDRIREEARVEGFARGLEAGRAEALRAARDEAARECAAASEVLRAAAAAVDAERAALVASGERELLRLALRLAALVVKAEAASGSRVAADNVRRALELAVRRRDVRIRIHPGDAAALDGLLPEFRREFADLGTVALEADPAVGRGGCVLETPEGAVDASIASQFEALERGLLG